MSAKNEKFYLVSENFLPDGMKKTLEAKKLLENHTVESIHEATRQVGLSRSVFYKYRDAVFPFQHMVKEQMITLFFHLKDQTGVLSHLLSVVAQAGCNILTIHQTIPIQGKANVTLSLNTSGMTIEIDQLIEQLTQIDFVNQVEILSSGVS
ncbi:ACT domain-containing protein [Gracilibacillus sp. S3-1-1]|uniref:ACT domain-containing protein n=1 Tax=Gracilibacillus pellucidus TaxID=3095368 RepID=A0ACC6M6K1_9BACI|nr:ACT domain-containing protein [Gracilibacillus sp. S3-1-1]MDX8046550.1 ACT domain-containing protein [Gracilibacillus sp. S3-1-1]